MAVCIYAQRLYSLQNSKKDPKEEALSFVCKVQKGIFGCHVLGAPYC